MNTLTLCSWWLLCAAIGHGPESAVEQFRLGIEHRGNRVEAEDRFRRTAEQCDELWLANRQSPELAVLRARAHFLAGSLPQAILALHDGLALAPYDSRLKRDLLTMRDTVRYPESPDLRLRVRPDPPDELRHRISPWELVSLAAGFGLLGSFGLVRRFTTSPRWALPAATVGIVGFILCCILTRELAAADARPLRILTRNTHLRKGNGYSYSPRLAEILPRGCELRELIRRGDWIQVELPGGAAGWVPELCCLP